MTRFHLLLHSGTARLHADLQCEVVVATGEGGWPVQLHWRRAIVPAFPDPATATQLYELDTPLYSESLVVLATQTLIQQLQVAAAAAGHEATEPPPPWYLVSRSTATGGR